GRAGRGRRASRPPLFSGRGGAAGGASFFFFFWGGGGGAPAPPAASCSAASSRILSSDPAARSIPAAASPRSANRAGAVTRVKAAGSQPRTSSHSSGIDTRASGVGRTDHAEATARSLAFWL